MRIYCFGNEFIREDSFAKEIVDGLDIKGIDFKKCDSVEDIDEKDFEKLFIVDVVENISDVVIIDDVDGLRKNNMVSLHDFDLSFFLKLMRGINKISTVRIIGIPQKGDKEKIKKSLISKIQALGNALSS